MKPELQDYLINKFPTLYQHEDKKNPFAQHGFECEDGWFRLLFWVSSYLQSYIDMQNEHAKLYPEKYLKVEQVKVKQVKEKFGTLRFYYSGGNERIEAIVSFAQYISGFICEYSGLTENVGINLEGRHKTTNFEHAVDKKSFKFLDDEKLLSLLNQK